MRRPVHLSPVETAVLHAVARYRFINVALLGRVVEATPGTIRDATRRLRVLGLLGGTGPKAWKFDKNAPDGRREFGKPSLFWVSEHGADYLDRERQHNPAAPFVIGSRRDPDPTGKHVEHRLGIVAFHIAFRAWALATGKVGVSFLSDFEPGGVGIEKVTEVPYPWRPRDPWYRPDGFARFRLAPDQPQELMVLEFERGGAGQDLSPFFRFKLPMIRQAAAVEVVENAKGLAGVAPYLVVFASADARDRALLQWPDKTSPEWGRFFIKALPEIEAAGADFSRGWWRPDLSRPGLYAESA